MSRLSELLYGYLINIRNLFLTVFKDSNEDANILGSVEVSLPESYVVFFSYCVLTHYSFKNVKGNLQDLFYKGINPCMRAPPSWPNHFPEALPSNTIALRVFNILMVCVCGGVATERGSTHSK